MAGNTGSGPQNHSYQGLKQRDRNYTLPISKGKLVFQKAAAQFLSTPQKKVVLVTNRHTSMFQAGTQVLGLPRTPARSLRGLRLDT